MPQGCSWCHKAIVGAIKAVVGAIQAVVGAIMAKVVAELSSRSHIQLLGHTGAVVAVSHSITRAQAWRWS